MHLQLPVLKCQQNFVALLSHQEAWEMQGLQHWSFPDWASAGAGTGVCDPKISSLCSTLLRCSSWRLDVGRAFPLISVLAGTEQSRPVLNLLFLFLGWIDAVLGEGSVVPWSLSHPWWKPPCFLFFVAPGGAGHGCPAAAQTRLPHCPWAEGACQCGKCEIPPHRAPPLDSAKPLAQTQINNCREAGRDSGCGFMDASMDSFCRLPAVIWHLFLPLDRCVGFYFFYVILALSLCLSPTLAALILCVSLLLHKTLRIVVNLHR